MLDSKAIEQYQSTLTAINQELHKIIVGLDDVSENVLIAMLANGHILLEGVPGLGKTILVDTLSKIFNLKYTRIQFTPDLMPADITGTNIVMEDNEGHRFFQFQEGPLFAQLVLADEINRATSKTQSALLEAMQERSVTVSGITRHLKEPFLVLATQNPIELEGTYPLPEAQIDRFFFKIFVPYPNIDELVQIVTKTTGQSLPNINPIISGEELLALQQVVRTVPIASQVVNYVARLVLASHPHNDTLQIIKDYVRYGASPRGAQALVLAAKARSFMHGRYNVSFEDINTVAFPALRHRILLNFEAEASNVQIDSVTQTLIDSVPETE